eukprot:TRINITY_DN1663_c0_g1_i2.p1 TRINITY_DN1663_c0_g1~~TRINITY_DN1663_c0_g1_i2.p1  ORF type:complete len:294 (-),score=16.04 TRINITY_DN1663_c0_g1_i2:254-1135(-)
MPNGRGPWFEILMSVRERRGTGDVFDTAKPWEDLLREDFNTRNGPFYTMRTRGRRSGDFIYSAPGLEPLEIGRWCYLSESDLKPFSSLQIFQNDDENHHPCPYIGKRLGWITFEATSHKGDVFRMMSRICRGRYIDARSGGGWWLLRDDGEDPIRELHFSVDASISQGQLTNYKIKYGDTYHAYEFLASPLSKTPYGGKLKRLLESRAARTGHTVVGASFWGICTDSSFSIEDFPPHLVAFMNAAAGRGMDQLFAHVERRHLGETLTDTFQDEGDHESEQDWDEFSDGDLEEL